MNSMTTKVHLVTIVCGNELEERVARDLAALGGISGFTVTRANGRGLHGPRKFGVTDSANIRLEILVVPPWADKVVAMLVANYQGDPLTAFVQEVLALPQSHFLLTSPTSADADLSSTAPPR
jgi:nitrogen regulatory protein PII